jgi:formamidase
LTPISKPSPIVPTYNDYLIFGGISVDKHGKQHYLDVHIAYQQACLNAIEYLKKFGYRKILTAGVKAAHARCGAD